jgi:hypothetical protein
MRLMASRPDLAARLRALLDSPPIPKPSKHESGADSDYLILDLDQGEIEDVVDALGDLESTLALDGHLDQAEAAGTLLDRWNAAESGKPGAA